MLAAQGVPFGWFCLLPISLHRQHRDLVFENTLDLHTYHHARTPSVDLHHNPPVLPPSETASRFFPLDFSATNASNQVS